MTSGTLARRSPGRSILARRDAYSRFRIRGREHRPSSGAGRGSDLDRSDSGRCIDGAYTTRKSDERITGGTDTSEP
jgi:hypothetical protein